MNNVVYQTITKSDSADPGTGSYTLSTTGPDLDFTLYSAVTYDARTIFVTRFDSFPGAKITVLPTGGETIDGGPSYALGATGSNVQFLAQNGNWLSISNNNAVATSVGTGSIQNNAVTNAKLAKMPPNTLKGNATGALADPQDVAGLPFTLTGDVSNPVGGTLVTIANDAITTPKVLDGAITAPKLAATGVAPGTYNFTTLTVNSGGQLSSASNGTFTNAGTIGVNTGQVLVTPQSGVNVNFRSLLVNSAAGQEGITLSNSGNDVLVGTNVTAKNLSAEGWFTSKNTSGEIQLKGAKGTAGQIKITSNANDLTFGMDVSGVTAGSYRMPYTTVASSGLVTSMVNGGFGNVALVDSKFGNDGTATLNGSAFLTVTAALTAASAVSGSQVYIFPGSYTETANITVPDNVSIRGISSQAVTIVGGAAVTDLLTMGKNSTVQDVSLSLTSVANVKLRGVIFPTTTNQSASLTNCIVTVSGAGNVANSISGVYSVGTAGTPAVNFNAVRNCRITVSNSGSAPSRGILMDAASGTHTINVLDNTILVTGTDSIGAETVANTTLNMRQGSISGASADISQTGGTLFVAGTSLANSKANSKGFSTSVTPSRMTFGEQGVMTPGVRFYFHGTFGTSTNEIKRAMLTTCVLRAMSVAVNKSGAVGNKATWVVNNNGAATGITLTLDGTGDAVNVTQSGSIVTASATFLEGDLLSVQGSTNGSGANPIDVQIVLGFY